MNTYRGFVYSKLNSMGCVSTSGDFALDERKQLYEILRLRIFGCKFPKLSFVGKRRRRSIDHVLLTMVDSSVVDAQAVKPGLHIQPRHVHGFVPYEFFLREKTLHDLQPCVSCCCFPGLLQLCW